MESSLHRQLKELCGGREATREVRLGRYRIDVVDDDLLIEVQHGSLAAIRDKVARLLSEHRLRVVKPLVAEKRIVRLDGPGGNEISRRRSPKREGWLDLFDELVYFTRVFPHPRLELRALLVEIEERRYPGHGRRRRWRANDAVVEDQRLTAVRGALVLREAADLWRLLPVEPPAEFDTATLAAALCVSRTRAQRIAYCAREMGAARAVGKRGNARVYRRAA